MSEDPIQVTITLSDPKLDNERLQEATRNLRLELEEFEGVREVNLIPDVIRPGWFQKSRRLFDWQTQSPGQYK